MNENDLALLTLYMDGPANLESAVAGLSEASLNLAPNADSWSIRQIVHHVVDGDDLWKAGVRAALGNEDGLFTLQWYWDKPQTAWAESWAYASRPIAPSLALLRANRAHTISLLEHLPGVWEKTIRVRWPGGNEKRISIRDILDMQANHVVGHINDINMIRQMHHI